MKADPPGSSETRLADPEELLGLAVLDPPSQGGTAALLTSCSVDESHSWCVISGMLLPAHCADTLTSLRLQLAPPPTAGMASPSPDSHELGGNFTH